MKNNMQKFGIAYNEQISDTAAISSEICTYLTEAGAQVLAVGAIHKEKMHRDIASGKIDALIVLGGDGTILRASHLCASAKIPIVGVNFGTMGFLIELQRDEWKQYFSRLLSGDFRIEKRMMLQAEATGICSRVVSAAAVESHFSSR